MSASPENGELSTGTCMEESARDLRADLGHYLGGTSLNDKIREISHHPGFIWRMNGLFRYHAGMPFTIPICLTPITTLEKITTAIQYRNLISGQNITRLSPGYPPQGGTCSIPEHRNKIYLKVLLTLFS
jgi:hypothetical protein